MENELFTEKVIKNIRPASEFFPCVKESDLPLLVEQLKLSNGREKTTVFNTNGKMVSQSTT